MTSLSSTGLRVATGIASTATVAAEGGHSRPHGAPTSSAGLRETTGSDFVSSGFTGGGQKKGPQLGTTTSSAWLPDKAGRGLAIVVAASVASEMRYVNCILFVGLGSCAVMGCLYEEVR
jgi:hypothetical protein